MISEEQIEQIIEKLVDRIEQANTYFLMQIGKSVKQIKELTPTKALQLANILKYGGKYEDIVREIAKYTGLNIKDIDKIFSAYAKKDQLFYEKFYKYRDIPFVPYEDNIALQNEAMALSNLVKNTMYDFTRASVLGYTIRDLKGRPQFYGLRETFNRVIDEAVLNISQGKDTFDSAMYNILKDIGGSGLKTIEYQSGRKVRLDSAVRTYLKDNLNLLHNEMQEIYGEEFKYNGIEVSHHPNAAPDHIDTVDGKQFVLVDKIQEQIKDGTEQEIKQEDIRGNQVKVKGKTYQDFNVINNSLDRQVSTLNCRHTTFSIIVGISKPEYTEEQLKADKQKNMNGFDFDGKHYTMYEGTQLQRNIEKAIREQKDTQILAKASGNNELIADSQQKITQLTHKYRELSNMSGLPTKMERARVSGYKRTKIPKINENKFVNFNVNLYQDPKLKEIGEKYFNFPSNNYLDEYVAQREGIMRRMAQSEEYKNKMYNIAENIEELKTPSLTNFIAFVGHEEGLNLTKKNFAISTSISEGTARLYKLKKGSKAEISTIYIENGAKIISTVNTISKHFEEQGEIIIPMGELKKFIKIGKNKYLYRR